MRTRGFSSADRHPEKDQERRDNRNDISEAEGEDLQGLWGSDCTHGLSGRPGGETARARKAGEGETGRTPSWMSCCPLSNFPCGDLKSKFNPIYLSYSTLFAGHSGKSGKSPMMLFPAGLIGKPPKKKALGAEVQKAGPPGPTSWACQLWDIWASLFTKGLGEEPFRKNLPSLLTSRGA